MLNKSETEGPKYSQSEKETNVTKENTLFLTANQGRDYSIYTRFMDAALHAKAHSLFPYFGELNENAVIVDAGSGTGQLAELAAREFRGASVYALDISHELLEMAEKGKSLIHLVNGNAIHRNFPPNSVDVKYYSTSGHEIETFGGEGSMEQAVKNTLTELKPGGKIVIRDFVKPNRKEPIYMKIHQQADVIDIPIDTPIDDIDYNLLSPVALFRRFHQEFQEGNAFSYEEVKRDGETYFKLSPKWAYEFYMRKDYTANWRQEIKEKYSYWTLEDARSYLENCGFTNVKTIADPNQFIVSKRLKGQIELYEENQGELNPIDFPPTHMIIVGEKPYDIKVRARAIEDKDPAIDYEKIISTVRIDRDTHRVYIGEDIFEVEDILEGSKTYICRLKNDTSKVLKIVRADTYNLHNVFKSIYQIIERQNVLDAYETPHVHLLSHDGPKPPYRYLIQEDIPKGSVNAAELIKGHALKEDDIRQMAEIVNKYEKKKEWQIDTNPYSWFRVTQDDGTTQMIYVSNKVYRYDEQWKFRKVGLLQWLDPKYVENANYFSAEIPTAKEYEELQNMWSQESEEISAWKKYLDKDIQPS